MADREPIVRVTLPRWAAITLAFAIAVVTIGPIAGMLVYFAVRAPGEKVASIGPALSEPFELEYTSDGRPQRVWIDMTCTGCDPNSVEGTLVARTSTGATLASVHVRNVLSGYSQSGSENTTIDQHSVVGHPVMQVPAQPVGTTIVVSGTLSPEPRQIYEIGPLRLNEGRGLPRIQALSVWVAR